jgi:hypothetical protein
MSAGQGFGLNVPGRRLQEAKEADSRAAGSPLPVGQVGHSALHSSPEDLTGYKAAPGPGRALPSPGPKSNTPPETFSLQRAFSQAMPYLQKLLPILDGNIATAMANLMAARPPAPPPAPVVNLEPLEDGLAALQIQQRDLRAEVIEQNSSLKRVEDQLEMVREATDRNTLEQQELMEDLKAVGGKVNFVAIIALVLLAASIALNVALYLHISRVLPE